MNNFSINPNFNTTDFNNTIQNFNKTFGNSLSQADDNFANFQEIFNSIQEKNTQPLQAKNEMFVGLDAINAQKIDSEMSPSAKMAHDIGQSFTKSLNDLNKVEKQAEHDFETFASGGDISVHDVMISAQKSGLAMQMAIQLRNQMLNAYNEFKTMQL